MFFNVQLFDSLALDPGEHTLVVTNLNGTSPNTFFLDNFWFVPLDNGSNGGASASPSASASASASVQSSEYVPFSRLHACLRLILSIQLGYKIVNYLVELFANDAASYSYISSSHFRKCQCAVLQVRLGFLRASQGLMLSSSGTITSTTSTSSSNSGPALSLTSTSSPAASTSVSAAIVGSTSSRPQNLAAIVGGAVGGAVAALLLVALVLYYLISRRLSRASRGHHEDGACFSSATALRSLTSLNSDQRRCLDDAEPWRTRA